MNKRGQQLSITTLVMIILAVLVLIFLVLGFTVGWKKILPWIKPSNNVQEVADSCKLACSTDSVYDYCTKTREVYVEEPITIGGESKAEFSDTCSNLSNKTIYEEAYKGLGIEECSGLCS